MSFKVEYIQTVEISNSSDDYFHLRINGIDCTIELHHDSAIEIGHQLAMEIERVLNQVNAIEKYKGLESIKFSNSNSIEAN